MMNRRDSRCNCCENQDPRRALDGVGVEVGLGPCRGGPEAFSIDAGYRGPAAKRRGTAWEEAMLVHEWETKYKHALYIFTFMSASMSLSN